MKSINTTLYLTIEFLTLFILMPGVIYLLMPLPVLPFLWLIALICYRLLRSDPHFDHQQLWNYPALKPHIKEIIILYALVSTFILLSMYLFIPDHFLSLIKTNPLLWLLIILFYPLLSVYPQELVYRTFFFHRYGHLFSSQARLIWGSAISFSFMHIIFHNYIAVILTLGGGWIFASIYARTHSTFVVSLVHILYGTLIFTAGLGEYFFHGTMRTLMQLTH